MQIFRPEDFGALADGMHNDAIALWKAIAEASAYEGEAQVLLQADKTYRFGPTEDQKCGRHQMLIGGLKQDPASMNCTAPIAIEGAKNVHVKGSNTTILIDPPYNYCNVYNCENITIEGLTFDYSYHPFAKGTLVELDAENHKAVIQTDRSLRIASKAADRGFSILQRPDSRYHMRSLAFSPIDPENFLYEVEFKDEPATNGRLEMMREYPLIVPMPGFGHCIERAFSVCGNKNVTFKDCTIHSMARFGFVLFQNDGAMIFDNVKAKKAENESVNIVGWRDLFHVKENHAKFIWKNCYAEHCYDDIFNISASTLSVQKAYAEDDIDFIWNETKGVYSAARVGDTISVIDFATGKDYGEAKIVEIVEREGSHNRFRLDRPIKGVEDIKDSRVHVLDAVSPGSVIEDCEFHGTYRLRGPIDVKNTYFETKRFWLDTWFPGAIGEGPVPKHIHFTNCRFECDDEAEPYFHIESHRVESCDEPQYHIEDMVFENCEIPMSVVEIGESDKSYVKFVNCNNKR